MEAGRYSKNIAENSHKLLPNSICYPNSYLIRYLQTGKGNEYENILDMVPVYCFVMDVCLSVFSRAHLGYDMEIAWFIGVFHYFLYHAAC
ncbi:hypothetical protein GCM10028868_15690 [Virgibacillus kimchii]